jgi:hypothetical protein
MKLALIVGSLSIVSLAGHLAQSRGQDVGEVARPNTRIVTAVATVPDAHSSLHRLTPTERYARSQIQTFTEVLDGLTERAEVIMETVVVPEGDAKNLKDSLLQLDQDLMAAREAFARHMAKPDLFSEEDLRESVMALQDSASRAQGRLITLDTSRTQSAQGFKVSRTGQ